jgi:hypothetical protein
MHGMQIHKFLIIGKEVNKFQLKLRNEKSHITKHLP